MDKESLKSLLLEKAKDKKLPCKLAFKISEENNVPLKEIGNMANELGIKIIECQLGCFK